MGKKMSKRTDRLSRNRAIAALNLKNKGMTNTEIAKQMGVDTKKVSDMIKRGERLIAD
jgi:DNA-binding transcriptional regulator LsrR (DeoR family)